MNSLFLHKLALPARLSGIKLITIKLAILISFLLFFISCSDDVVIQKTEDFDPPRFNWRAKDVSYHGYSGMWAIDTNKIFILNNIYNTLNIVQNDYTESHYVGEYGLEKIDGISNNEIYIFGGSNYPENAQTIIKWNGAGFEFYPTGIITTPGWGTSIKGLAVNSNEIWLCSQDGISMFDGIKMNYFVYEDSLLIPTNLFYTNDNKLQYIAIKYFDTFYIQQCLFEFRDTGFVRIYNYIGNPEPLMTYTFLNEIGGYKYGLELKRSPWSICIHNFYSSLFTAYFCFNNKILDTWPSESNNPVGSNLQNFIFLISSSDFIFEPGYKVGIIHWNGYKESKEIGLRSFTPFPYTNFILRYINDDCFLVLGQYTENVGNSTLYIATRKTGQIKDN